MIGTEHMLFTAQQGVWCPVLVGWKAGFTEKHLEIALEGACVEDRLSLVRSECKRNKFSGYRNRSFLDTPKEVFWIPQKKLSGYPKRSYLDTATDTFWIL